MNRKVIVALDVSSREEALHLVEQLRDLVGMFKVGSQLFMAAGQSIVQEIIASGGHVFLDLKFHDIPNTVAQAVESAVHTGAWMINVHASGGVRMMQAAAKAGRETAARLGRPAPLLIAVTVLTSMDQPALAQIGVQRPVLDHVVSLARLAEDAGLDGVVASPLETARIREACGPQFVIVTPGIRGASANATPDDQSRTMAPAEAIRAGASYIVVGRPIIAAADPRAAAQAIADEVSRSA